MSASDWLAGFAVAAFLAIPFGMVVMLVATVTEKPGKFDPDAPLISPLDTRRCMVASLVFLVIFTPLCALIVSKDRAESEDWQAYVRDHKCVAVDRRTRTHYRLNPATKMNESSSVIEYLWRCEGGDEHWRP